MDSRDQAYSSVDQESISPNTQTTLSDKWRYVEKEIVVGIKQMIGDVGSMLERNDQIPGKLGPFLQTNREEHQPI